MRYILTKRTITQMKKIFFAAMTVLLTLSACQESLEDQCTRMAKEYTARNCPAPIGENVTIDSLVFERSTHTMCYYYTLSGDADSKAAVERADPRKVLLPEVKNSTSVKAYKDAGYNFKYTYCSAKNKGVVLYTVTFTKKDYQS